MIVQYQKVPNNIMRYLIISLIILGLIIIVPSSRLSIKDSVIVSAMLTLILYAFEHVTIIMTSDAPVDKFESTSDSSTNAVASTNTTTTSNKQTQEKSKLSTAEIQELAGETKQTPPLTNEQAKAVVQQYNDPNAEQNTAAGSRDKDDVITNELPYTDYNHLPMADSYKPSDFEYGDSFLPPEKWYPQPPFPPLCVSEKRCPVCPVFTTGTPVDVKEWNSSRRIMPPDRINVKYIEEKLNSGR